MDPFLAEIRIFAFNYAPQGWAICQGQTIPISQSPALFSLLGNTYGGDGFNNFGLPNMQGACALQQGAGAGLSSYSLGQTGGGQTVTLSSEQMPAHDHLLNASQNTGTTTTAQGNQFAAISTGGSKEQSYVGHLYSPNPGSATMDLPSASISLSGSGQPHSNMMPYLPLNFCIALTGIVPQRP